ncbi:hypothetical protein AAF712_000223 [Marasmius tenuissimus]|uniref:Mei2-like C-terminal RNA recognition motif domain-containing protein n=1 Tax=Marasmius tenuissimus TaxID=585030 RepID=A0ABR3AG70_9AGAR
MPRSLRPSLPNIYLPPSSGPLPKELSQAIMNPNSALLTPPLTPSSSLNSAGDPTPSRYISVAPIRTDIQVDFLEFTFCTLVGGNHPKPILDIVTLPDSPSTRILVLDDLRKAVMLRDKLANIPPILRTCLYRDTHVLHVDFLSPQAVKHMPLDMVPIPRIGDDAVASVYRDPASGAYSVNFHRLSDAECVCNSQGGELDMQVSYEEEVIYSTTVKRDSDGFYEPASSSAGPYQFPPTPPIPGPGPPLPPHMHFPQPWIVNEQQQQQPPQPPPFVFPPPPPWFLDGGAMLPGVPGPLPPSCFSPPQPEPSYWMPVPPLPPMIPQPPPGPFLHHHHHPMMAGFPGGESQDIQFNSAVEDAFYRVRGRSCFSSSSASSTSRTDFDYETQTRTRTQSKTRTHATQPQPAPVPAPSEPPTTSNNGTRTANILSLPKIASGLDTRTTVMIKNVPNKLSSTDLLHFIQSTIGNRIDFLYLRIDFRNECNFGYAFVNFIGVEDLVAFVREKGGKRWNLHSSNKVLELCYADYQGKEALVEKFKNSGIMDEKVEWRPRIFHSEEGPMQGMPEPFPEATHQRRKERGRSLRVEETPVTPVKKQWNGNGSGKAKRRTRSEAFSSSNPFGVLAVAQEGEGAVGDGCGCVRTRLQKNNTRTFFAIRT